jgi:hydrogenase nickel incorporation protein HypB
LRIPVVRKILEVNDRIANEHRALFRKNNLLVLNLMSSPGAGKTTLLEHTIGHLREKCRIGVIEGDIQTSVDAERIAKSGAVAVQINTDGACHLDANMISEALPAINVEQLDVLFVENVGNLVCPAEFDLGEYHKVMMLSVTEGDDKPEKYPLMFHEASVLLINKTDLLPYVDCDMGKIRKTVLNLNPHIKIFEISCQTQEGLGAWYRWILDQKQK